MSFPHSFRHGPHPWPHQWPPKRRFVFWRFVALFGGMWILSIAAIGVVLLLAVVEPQRLSLHRPVPLLLAACGVPLGVFLTVSGIGRWAFRNIGTPMAEVMAAADAVANGDLDVRLKAGAPGEFGRLARSFNRMTSELARAEQQRRSLTADVAHELRTPLHLIQGNLEGILDGVYEPSQEHIQATLEETYLLSRLVSDLQTLSQAEAGQLPLHPVRFSVADLLADVSTSFSGQAVGRGVDLEIVTEGDTHALDILADPDRLDQVLSNLVANALRYTPEGGRIYLRAAPVPDGIRLSVEDTGAGISPEDLPYIFDRFWRGDRARSRSEGAGSGLGLAIARQLIQAQGGKIGVESQPGVGTTFTIDLITGL